MTSPVAPLLNTLAEARAEVGKVLIGQQPVIDQSLIVIFTNQHALIEGVPGVAKMSLVCSIRCPLPCSAK